jgi:hypothetical protein
MEVYDDSCGRTVCKLVRCRVRRLRDRHGNQGWHAAVGPVGDRSDSMTTLFRRVKWIVQRALCGLFGHDTLLQFEQHRLSLRCASCGHETTGWAIGEDGARARAAVRPHTGIETRHAA